MEFDFIRDAENKGPVFNTGFKEDWLEKAIRQHPAKVPIELARTEPIRFKRLDIWDFIILFKEPMN